MNAHDQEAITRSVRTYARVFAMLLALTLITLGAARLDLAIPVAIGVALVIATLKGSLVASFFMHLIAERPPVYAVLILTGILLAALLVLPLLMTLEEIGAIEAFAR